MKRLGIYILMGVMMLGIGVSAKSIPSSELPLEIKTFIAKHFPNSKISFAKYDREFYDSSYDVILTNGDKLEFKRKGTWEEIDCRHSRVPQSILTNVLRKAATTYGKGAYVIGLEREKNGYKMKFSNGVKIKVDFNGVMTDRED